MEKVILSKISYFCEMNNVISVNQAGFRKGRSKIDHLVKLTTHIKKQFSQRKSILATLLEVKKQTNKTTYIEVWHARLLYKFKNIDFSEKVRNISNHFCQKVGHSFLAVKNTDMGIITPIVFNIMIHILRKPTDMV